MENTMKKSVGRKNKAGTSAVGNQPETVKQPGIIFSGFKSKLSSGELLERMNVEGK